MVDENKEDAESLDDVLNCEHAVWQALVDGDVEADKSLLMPEFVGVYPTGFAGREDHADQLMAGPSVVRYALSEARLLEVGLDFRLLCYRADYLRVSEIQPEAMFVSSLWQRVGTEWKNLFSQDTPAGNALDV